jgi:hypothetical protein
MLTGFVGLISLIIREWHGHSKLHTIIYVFSGVFGFFVVISGFLLSLDGGLVIALISSFLVFTMLSALFCDWSLGAMTNNLLGMPSGDSASLYWSYFALKRLTMFSL